MAGIVAVVNPAACKPDVSLRGPLEWVHKTSSAPNGAANLGSREHLLKSSEIPQVGGPVSIMVRRRAARRQLHARPAQAALKGPVVRQGMKVVSEVD